MNTGTLERQRAEENTWEGNRGRAATKWNGNGIQFQKEEQFVSIAWGSKGTNPLEAFTARVSQIIAQILASPHTGVSLNTPPQLKGKSQHFAFSRLFLYWGRCAPSTSAPLDAPAGIFTWTSYSSLLGWLSPLQSSHLERDKRKGETWGLVCLRLAPPCEGRLELGNKFHPAGKVLPKRNLVK